MAIQISSGDPVDPGSAQILDATAGRVEVELRDLRREVVDLAADLVHLRIHEQLADASHVVANEYGRIRREAPVAAELVGIPWEKVDVVWGNTGLHLPSTCNQGGSQTAHAMTRAAPAFRITAAQARRVSPVGGSPPATEQRFRVTAPARGTRRVETVRHAAGEFLLGHGNDDGFNRFALPLPLAMDTCAANNPPGSGRGQAAMRYLPRVRGESLVVVIVVV